MNTKDIELILDGKSKKSTAGQVWSITKFLTGFLWCSTKFVAKNTPAALGMAWEVKKEQKQRALEEKKEVLKQSSKTMKILALYILLYTSLFAQVNIYLHMPSDMPSKKITTSFGLKLIELIENADEKIDFAIYGLRGQNEVIEALMKAKKRGVKLRGLVDTNSHNENYYSDTHLLFDVVDIKSDHKSYIMHNKFFIFDEKIVWTGSSNISDTGTGGYNANNVAIVQDDKIASIYTKEFNQMYEDKRFSKKKLDLTSENIASGDSIVSVYFSPKSDTYNRGIKRLIDGAKYYIHAPVFYLTHKDFSDALIDAKYRGVKVRIILDASAASNKYSTHHYLRSFGIQTKVENFGGKMHAKSLIIDDLYTVTGSMNFTKAGNEKNDENTLVIKDEKIAKEYNAYFNELWAKIPEDYLDANISAESVYSGNSCYDEIDNDFDNILDLMDGGCKW